MELHSRKLVTIITFITDVDVLRPEKFKKKGGETL